VSEEGMLKVQNKTIVTPQGKPVRLRGVNLGGWLMMEGYILHAPNRPVKLFKEQFAHQHGIRALRDFEKKFYDHFIQESDFKKIAQLGFNCLRVPFHYALVEQSPYQYSQEGLRYLDRAVAWAEKYKIYVILDLHAACGAQNNDWHSDSAGKAALWLYQSYQQRTYALWEFLAKRYRGKNWVAGYDLLNESVMEDTKLLNKFYRELIRKVRSVDDGHILFVEGNRWAQDLDCLEQLDDDNLVLSIHCYVPLEFTCHFIPHLHYPLESGPQRFGKADLRKLLNHYHKIAQRRKCPVYVGEFGVHYRQGLYGEDQWLRDIVDIFEELGFHWTYWTYKAVKNNIFPDGIYSYMENPPWVNRQGPLHGWEMYTALWPENHRAMIQSWHTENFQENPPIISALKNALK